MDKISQDFLKLLNASQFKLTEFTALDGNESDQKWVIVNSLLTDKRFTNKAIGILLNYLFTKGTSLYFLMSQNIFIEMIANYPGWNRSFVNGKEYNEFRAILQNRGIIDVVSHPSQYGKTKGVKQAGLWVLRHKDFFQFLDLTNDYKTDSDAISQLKATLRPTPTSTGMASTDNERDNVNDSGSASEIDNDIESEMDNENKISEKEKHVQIVVENKSNPEIPRKSFRKPAPRLQD